MGHYTGLMYFGLESMNANDLLVYSTPRMRNYLQNNGPWSQLIKMDNISLEEIEHQNRLTLSVFPSHRYWFHTGMNFLKQWDTESKALKERHYLYPISKSRKDVT